MIELTPQDGVGAVTAEFHFTNTGSYPITVRRADASWRTATVQRPRQRTFRPGQGGTVTVTLPIAERYGEQACTLTVLTAENASPEYPLTVTVRLPELIEFSPESLIWESEDAVSGRVQTIDITPGTDQPIRVLDVYIMPAEAFSAELEEIEAGHRYRVTVKPSETANSSIRAQLIIDTDHRAHEYAHFSIPLAVLSPDS